MRSGGADFGPRAAGAAALPRVRPVRAADGPALQAVLPPEVDRRLPEPGEPGGWWVLVDPQDQPLACLRLRARIGAPQPRPWFHRGCVVHAAPALGLWHPQPTLLLGHDFTGASELADACWWDPAGPAAGPAAWAPLLWTALLHLAAHRTGHGDTLVAELPGRRDATGQSPFWQALGARLGAPAPGQVKARLGPDWRGPLAELLPHQPVHAGFLGADAQAALGQAAPEAAAWRACLRQAGLSDGRHVTIDEGGPVMQAQLADLPGLRRARQRLLQAAPDAAERGGPTWRPAWCWQPARGEAGLGWGRALRGGGWQPREPLASAVAGEPVWVWPLAAAQVPARR